MGSVDVEFGRDLRAQVGLQRAVETGTFKGITARKLAQVFPSVTTIELSADLQAAAARALADVPAVTSVQGDGPEHLARTVDPAVPTLYFLDGHWSGGSTEGVEEECPVLRELEAITGGHGGDCIVVDDARLFCSAPPPPHRPEQWPTLLELFDALRAARPGHLVTVLDDQVLAVPAAAKRALDNHGLRVQAAQLGPRARVGQLLQRVRRGG